MPGPGRPPPAPDSAGWPALAPGTPGGPDRGGFCPVLAGPTGVGKTALVLELATRWPLEVISLDSRQIYRGLRLGTAQPTAAEQAVCRHHLIDFVPPDAAYSAARYRHDFAAAYADVCARGRLPLLTGGAGLYLAALERGLLRAPGLEPAAAARVRAALAPLTDDEVRSRLREADPASWARIPAGDRYRSRRALEICVATGRPMSAQVAAQVRDPVLGLRFPLVYVTRPRPELHQRIAARTRAMLRAGWIAETEALMREHGPEARALRAIGYREVVACIQGALPPGDLEERIVTATRRYAKRQQTWFRPLPNAAAGAPEDTVVRETLARLLDEAGALL